MSTRTVSRSGWLGGVALALLALFVSASAVADAAVGNPATYTLDADFDEGTLNNVDHDVSNQLQLDNTAEPFDFVWVAVSTKGTIVKIDANTGVILGEYRSAPLGRALDPSRTTVDANGNVWATNRAESGFVAAGAIAPGVPNNSSGMGSLVHIGLKENGQCVDRNGNGTIDTSTGLNDIRPWTNGGGVNNLGGVSTAEDECIIHYTRVNSTGTRHVSVNSNNDIWVSGTGDRDFDLIDGTTGAIIAQAGSVGYGGYGGLIDGNDVIWSARPTLRWDASTGAFVGGNGDPAGLHLGPPVGGSNWAGQGGDDSYGTCINPNNGEVWFTRLNGNMIDRYSSAGVHIATYAHGFYYAQGCAIDNNGHVWVAHSILGGGASVGHLDAAGVFLGNVAVGSGPTGIAVDSNGKIWATNYYSGTVSRIDPALAGGIGAVDLTTVGLGGNPYNYSDMTGSTLTAPAGTGTWTLVHDTGIPGSIWGNVSWNALTPGDSSIQVTVASSVDGVTFSAPEVATNGGDLSVPDGQYLKVTVLFTRSSTDGDGDGLKDSPVLYDLTITAGEPVPYCDGLPATIVGTDGVDDIYGTDGDDVIVALGGDDEVHGLGGNDVICGGDGRDQLSGNDGDDRIFGEDGPDRIWGHAGNDLAVGGEGDDVIYGGAGNDVLLGNEGNDRLKGEGGNDFADGGDDNDTVQGGDDTDELHGGAGDDRLYGEDGDDLMFGENGYNVYYGGAGDDLIIGGDDKDRMKGESGSDACDGAGGTEDTAESCELVANVP